LHASTIWAIPTVAPGVPGISKRSHLHGRHCVDPEMLQSIAGNSGQIQRRFIMDDRQRLEQKGAMPLR
jgi:hypothetical protein